jgi:hypothetical protein
MRWLFFIVGKPLDYLAVLLQILYIPYFWFKVKSKETPISVKNKNLTLDIILRRAKKDPISDMKRIGRETHTLMTQSGNGLLYPQNAEFLIESCVTPSNSLYREATPTGEEGEAHMSPSGDGLSSWVNCYLLWNIKRPDLVKKVVGNYVKNCFGLWWDKGNGVSARSSNCGALSPIVDGWPSQKYGFGLSQPLTGPAFFTTQAALALAKRELSGLDKVTFTLLYYAHWLVNCGWFYSLIPILYIKKDSFYYTHHVTALNLNSLAKCGHRYKTAAKWLMEANPTKTAQPWITAALWDVSLCSQKDRDEDLALLLSCESPISWPQKKVDSEFYTSNDTTWSMMAYAVLLLSKIS